MAKYRVWVRLECEYYDIEADNEQQAFLEASDCAIGGGDWEWEAEEIEDDQ